MAVLPVGSRGVVWLVVVLYDVFVTFGFSREEIGTVPEVAPGRPSWVCPPGSSFAGRSWFGQVDYLPDLGRVTSIFAIRPTCTRFHPMRKVRRCATLWGRSQLSRAG